LDIITVNLPSSVDWQTAPQTYAYYVGTSAGMGAYPQNTQKLTEDLVRLVNPFVNFADYDNDGDGFVDGLTVVHAGSGYEQSGVGIWSHKWAVRDQTTLFDGVRIQSYSIQPEHWVAGQTPIQMTPGVYAHEWGHIFGLPDLYPLLGMWALMARGSWNGYFGAAPAWHDTWCRQKLGFGTFVEIRGVQTVTIRPNTLTDTVYWCRATDNATGRFLIDNPVQSGLPYAVGSAIVYMVDDGMNGNNSYAWCPPEKVQTTWALHPTVRIMQPDGLCQIETNANIGNSGDVWPLDGVTVVNNFVHGGDPSTEYYSGARTGTRMTGFLRIGTKPYSVRVEVCTCDRQGDMDSNGKYDAVDIQAVIFNAFDGGPPMQSVGCQRERADINCDKVVDIIDVSLMGRAVKGKYTPCANCF
jgi:immune inhibitor A